MFKVRLGVLVFLILMLSCLSVYASIVSTEVSADMTIEYDDFLLSGLAGSSLGISSANVSLEDTVTGVQAHSLLNLSSMTSESALLEFDLGLDGNNYSGTGYMGGSAYLSNYAQIIYFADVDTKLSYMWDFSYTGPEPFGLSYVFILQNGVELNPLGNYGSVGSFQGMDTFSLFAGNEYAFKTAFNPNVSGAIGSIEGQLSGNFAYQFTPVPEPSTFILLGGGLAGLAFAVRRRKKE